MPTYQIKNSTLEDIDKICWLFRDAISFQKRNGYPEFKWEDREGSIRHVLNKTHYKVIMENEIVGVFNVQLSDSPAWRHHDKGNAIYLHGVLVDRRFKGQRIFKKMLDWSIEYALVLKKDYVRLDTWANNPTLERYYYQLGFEKFEDFKYPSTKNITLNSRGNQVVLMQYPLKDLKS